MKSLLKALGISVVCGLFLTGSTFHEYYVSLTRIEYNAEQRSWEMSLKVFTDDLERALSEKNGKQLVIREGDGNDRYVAQYLATHFRWENGPPQTLHYVGKEQEADATWIYCEITQSTPVFTGVTLTHDVLMEIFDTQVNMVTIIAGDQKKTYLFRKNKRKQTL